MICEYEGCKDEIPNDRNRKFCLHHSKLTKKLHKKRWADKNKKYHYEYFKKWNRDLKEIENNFKLQTKLI